MWLATWAARSRVLRITELAPPLWINLHPNAWVLSLRWYVNLFLQTSIWETITVRIGLKTGFPPLWCFAKVIHLWVTISNALLPLSFPTQTSCLYTQRHVCLCPNIYAPNCMYVCIYIYIYIYSQVHKYWDIDTILTFLALYTTTMDFKWNEQDVL